METGTLEKKISALPDNLKLKVEGYVDALLNSESENGILAEPQVTYKTTRAPRQIYSSGKGTFGKMADNFDESLQEKPKQKREFGGLKGFVTYMADDFNAPLEDFKDYM
jgi:hypothetical protein